MFLRVHELVKISVQTKKNISNIQIVILVFIKLMYICKELLQVV